MLHTHSLRVYYEDTDFSGFAYHASVLRFFERGRTEFLRALGIAQSALHRETGFAFVVSRISVHYLKPAAMDDVLSVATVLERLGGASIILAQEIRRDGVCLTRASVTVAALRGGRPARLPASLRAAMASGTAEDKGDGGMARATHDTLDAATGDAPGDAVAAAAARHGFSPAAAEALYQALARGGGQAQFSHPELGGMGQWSRGGTMIGDMFNDSLKGRVDTLARDLAALPAPRPATVSASTSADSSPSSGGGGSWWPSRLGSPAASGSQNGVAYAYFAEARRLAVQRDGAVVVYDTGDHRISGIAQAQGRQDREGGGLADATFTSQHGPVRLGDLEQVGDAPAAGSPRPAREEDPGRHDSGSGASGSGDPAAAIERLHELHRKGILDEAEYRAKKAELLARM